MALLSGMGTLRATVSPIVPINVAFASDGHLSIPLISEIVPSLTALTSDGALSALFAQIYSTPLDLNSEGTLSAGVTVPSGLIANFASEGFLTASVEGGWSQGDGLSAWWYQVYEQLPQLSGSGTLVANLLSELAFVAAMFTGSGTLTGVSVIPDYPVIASMAGSGALSAQAFALYQRLATLSGSGQVGAQAAQQYLASAGYSGGSALAALVRQSYPATTGGGGVGTLGVTVSQVYTVTPALSGGGSLSATVVSTPLMSTLTDDFTTQDNTKWTYMPGASVTAQGYAQIIPGNAANVTITSNSQFNLRGSSASIGFIQDAEQAGGTSGQVLGQILTVDPSGYGWSIWRYGTSLVMRETTAAGGAVDVATITYDQPSHRFRRIRESGGTIFWETSPDDITWTTQFSKVGDASIQIGLMQAQLLGYWTGSGAPGVILLDNFNIAVPTAFTSPAFAGGGSISATRSIVFSPISEDNVARSGVAIPVGATQWRFTAIGAGAGGGKGGAASFSAEGGGGGGGGGGYIDTGWQNVSLLGSTFSVSVPTTGGGTGAAGAAASFTSGSITASAGGGSPGGGGTSSGQGAGGGGGGVTATGFTAASTANGGAGTTGGAFSTGGSSSAAANTTNSGPGGSGGGGRSGGGVGGSTGNGGSSSFAAGGTGSASGAAGKTGASAGAAQAGGGGSGSGGYGSGTVAAGGNGGSYGAGGGGSGGGNTAGNGGSGAPGFTRMQWQ